MAKVTLEIGGSRWPVNCRDGEEAQVARLGAMLEARWAQAQRAAGDPAPVRIMLLVALMLADDLADAQAREAEAASNDDDMLTTVADRLEKLASALERGAPSD